MHRTKYTHRVHTNRLCHRGRIADGRHDATRRDGIRIHHGGAENGGRGVRQLFRATRRVGTRAHGRYASMIINRACLDAPEESDVDDDDGSTDGQRMTTDARDLIFPFFSRADVERFYAQCDPDKENLCLYGNPDGTWEVQLPAEEVPPELPEPALGINFARDGMQVRLKQRATARKWSVSKRRRGV